MIWKKKYKGSPLSIKWYRLPFIITSLLVFLKGTAQVNYVLNPSFEEHTKCPYADDQIKFATGWSAIDTLNYPLLNDSFGSPNCTPEYCNTCATQTVASVPHNGFFYHYPRTGNGIAQMLMFYIITPDPFARNYLRGNFYKYLTANKSYCVTFFTTLEQRSQYAINHIGAYIIDKSIDTITGRYCGYPHTNYVPQAVATSVINDTLNWVKIEGSFTATGHEQYIVIGDFYDSAHTAHDSSISRGDEGTSYYLIDDVSVVESDIPAYAGPTVFKAKKDSAFVGRNEILPDIEWYRNGALIDTVHAGFWIHDTVNCMYVVKQSICGLVKYDTVNVYMANESVGGVENKKDFAIYPNPARDEITIHAKELSLNPATLQVCDLSGRTVMSKEVSFISGDAKVNLSLAAGVYIVKLCGSDGKGNIERLILY